MATMVRSMALEGIEGFPVEIEAATIRGQQQMISIIGLGDQAVKEAGERMCFVNKNSSKSEGKFPTFGLGIPHYPKET